MDFRAFTSCITPASNPLLRKILLIVVAMVSSCPAFAQDWLIKDLGNLGGDDQQALNFEHMAYGINNSGQVVGWAIVPPQIIGGVDTYHFLQAFVSAPNGGPLTNLHKAEAPEALEWDSTAMDINDSGQVIFRVTRYQALPASLSSAPPYTQAEPVGPGYFVVARDINNHGQVVGQGYTDSFIFDLNTENYTDITLGTARGINDSGQILLDNETATYLWSQETGLDLVTSENANRVESVGLNNFGQVIGYEWVEHKRTAYITDAGGDNLSYLDTLGGDFTEVMGINNKGQVVGQSQTVDGIYHAFFTGPDSRDLIDLESLQEIIDAGWSNIRLAAINDFGQIAGTGTHDGIRRPFLLSPVPEPETWAMMLAGLSMLGLARRSSHRRIIPTRPKTMEVKP